MMELMLVMDSRGNRLIDTPSGGSASASENQGVCGVTGDPVQESMLCRGEGLGGISDVEVLHEEAKDVFENDEECLEDSVLVFVIVGDRFGISGISASPNIPSGEKTIAFR